MRQQIVEFERMRPDVSIELTELTWERGEDKKRIAIAAGVGPDIITGPLSAQLVEQGFVEQVDDYMTPEEKADFFKPALDAFRYEDRIYGWPWYLTGSVMFVNLELFQRYGVQPPGPDWNYGQFLDAANRLTRDNNGDREPDIHGFGFLIRPGDTNAWPFLFPDGIRFALESSSFPSRSIQSARPGLARLHDLIHKYRVAPIQSGAWDTEALWRRFATQRDIAMAPWGIWAIPKLRTLEGFQFDVLPYPAIDDNGLVNPSRAFIGASGFTILRQRDPEKRRLCMEFARFLVRAEEQAQLANYGVFPSRTSAGDIYKDDEIMTRAQCMIAAGQTVPRHPEWAKIDEKLQREVQLALLGEKTPDAALMEASGQSMKILKKSEIPPVTSARRTQIDVLPFSVISIVVLAVAFTVIVILTTKGGRSASMSAYAFLAPALTVFAVFMLFPLCWVVALSFQDYSLANGSARWVGLDNLTAVFKDAVFVKSALNTLIYAAIVVPVNTFSALVVATLIYPLSKRARSFFRGAYYLPGVASVVVIAMVWRWMFNEDFGLLNSTLSFFGLPNVRWLTDPGVALWSVILTSIARPPGGPILIYLAALDAIPTSLYDAGEIDGAGPLKRWRHITVPLLRPTTLFLALTMTIASFQVFAHVLILTDGGPGYATEVVVHRIYTSATRDFDFGAASAMSLILFFVIMFVSAIQYRFFKSEFEY